MKKLILICGLFASSFSFGADWKYVTSTGSESFWVDKGYYKYDAKTKTVDLWSKSVRKKMYDKNYFTSSKTLNRISCPNKSIKQLAHVEYLESGDTSKSTTKPQANFSVIFPDSIGEGFWEVACKSGGKGFSFTKDQLRFMDMSTIDLSESQ
ncbi:surface-adhesin E family protein [Acinetobacter sp. 1125_18A]|uniref:surface-adhesin E family protein n=1 Tax=Acinetobacter sp. 1125_18A TaxID=2605959 RepID=UPI00405A019A